MHRIILLLCILNLKAADFRIKRSPAVDNMRVLDTKLHAAMALGVSPKTVERLIMSKVENYEKISMVAFPLKGQNIDDVKRELLAQCKE